MILKKEVEILVKAFEEHGTIILGCDFDDTIFPLSEDKETKQLCKIVRDLVKKVYDAKLVTLCLFTIASPQDVKYKVEIMDLWGIGPHFVNNSPVRFEGATKPYFNLLLDDKAGLRYTVQILTDFYDYTKK